MKQTIMGPTRLRAIRPGFAGFALAIVHCLSTQIERRRAKADQVDPCL